MFDFPNSSAMDATASSGGPSTFLMQIVTGQPQQIAAHSTGLLQKATQFISLAEEFTKAGDQLSKVWSGQASQSAVQKITSSLQSFQKIIQVIQNGAKLLGISGTLVQSAQTAYKSVVASVNPTVASLMSNPWTYSAAVALSTATSASLRAFITAIQGLLSGLGAAQLGAEIAALVQIIGEIEKLVQGNPATSASATSGTVPTNATIASTPLTMPVAPPPVASPTGQQASQNGITNYTPPALAGFTNPSGLPGGTTPNGLMAVTPTTATTPTGLPPTTQTGLTPSIDPNNSWIAVDPNQAQQAVTPPPAATAPAAPPALSGQEVRVTTTDGNISTTVEVPAGQAANVSIDATVNNSHITENFNIGADGSVRVS
jgi:uncharacterized protein YukE